jgi:uncharacterized SAM-binding protein YcdF (DUF218 family)
LAIALAIAGIVCIVYGITIMAAWSGTMFFAVWYAIGFALILCGWGVHAGAFDALPRFAHISIAGLSVVLIAGFLVAAGCSLSGFDEHGEPDLDCIVVLGAQMKADGPSIVLRLRLDAAYDYLVENPETVCIVSGGQGPNEPITEADGMADYLIERGIDESRIIRENTSTNTVENIRNSSAFFDAEHDRVGIVTNNFHVFRSVRIAQAQGVQNVCGISADSVAWYLPNNILRESMGIAKDLLKGNLG